MISPEPGTWLLHLPSSVVVRVLSIEHGVLKTEEGHEFWWIPTRFLVLMEHELSEYALTVHDMAQVLGEHLSRMTKAGIARPMAITMARAALQATTFSITPEQGFS